MLFKEIGRRRFWRERKNKQKENVYFRRNCKFLFEIKIKLLHYRFKTSKYSYFMNKTSFFIYQIEFEKKIIKFRDLLYLKRFECQIKFRNVKDL